MKEFDPNFWLLLALSIFIAAMFALADARLGSIEKDMLIMIELIDQPKSLDLTRE